MQSKWSARDAERMVKDYKAKGIGRELALRVYTTRLLGQDPALVLHGGGNTSVKTKARDLLGEEVDVLCVKGSGWDMGNIEPPGLPAVRLAALRKLQALDRLSDEDMVNFQRGQLLDANAPNPSVETLLHAFLPGKFIDHTHSTSVLAISDQADGEARLKKLFGAALAVVPYIMPGFALAKRAAEIARAHPKAHGLVLHKHGIFTFGDSAQQAYERMIAAVSRAEAALGRGRKTVFAPAKLPKKLAPIAEIAPILRGLTAIGPRRRPLIFDVRSNPKILAYVNGREVARYSQAGVVTPDHTIRTKNSPLVLAAPEAGKLAAFAEQAKNAVAGFVDSYHRYFERNNKKAEGKKKELDPMPRVLLVPGHGLIGMGKTAKDAAIAARQGRAGDRRRQRHRRGDRRGLRPRWR